MRLFAGNHSVRRAFVLTTITGLIAAGCGSASSDSTKAVTTTPASSDATSDSATTAAPVTDAPPVTEPVPVVTEPASDVKGWTVLVYSIADTDLEPFMMDDVTEMGTVGSNDNLNIFALVDRAAEYSSDPVLDIPDWQGAKLLDIGQGAADIVEEMGDINTGDPQVLADFITRGITENPAEHYSLIISDHGASWPGVGGDESSDNDTLSLDEINRAISAGLSGAGVGQLDLLGFDACLMATYEVASALAPVAQRMIASQELEPGHGWDYGSLSLLSSGEPVDVDTLGSAILDGYREQAKAQGTATDITLSLLDLTQMPALDSAMADFSAALAERAAEVAPVIGQTLGKTLGFGRNPDPTQDTHMADLGDLVSQIGVEALDVSDQADAVIRAIGDVVKRTVEGPATLKSTGLSIYFPPNDSLFSADYPTAVGDAPWLAMLQSYYGAGDAIPTGEQPRFTNADGTADISFGADGLTITGQLDPATVANIATSTVSYGVVNDDGSIAFLGEEPGFVADDGTFTASGLYDLTEFTISDGTDTVTGYFELTYGDDDGLATIDVPMAYYSPDDVGGEIYQDVLLSITLDAETFDIIEETYYVYNEELGTYGELTADPRGIIIPEIFFVSADGVGSWEPTSDVGLFAELASLQYDISPLESGTALYIDLSVTDFGGNSALVSAVTDVP